jgi:DNA-binding response OmpR family regulator
MAYRLLVVSGEKAWADSATATAASAGHQAQRASTAATALSEVLKGGCDLALIDVDLPSLEGLRWLEALRQTDQGRGLPVIVASKRRSDDDLARAFELGVDDYVLKSVHPQELSARLRSVLRRRFERSPLVESMIAIGPVELDPSKHECRVRHLAVELHPREFELLETLMRKAGRVLSRAYLLETVWGMDRSANTRAVDVAVSRLRKALGARAAKYLETVERYGYRFKTSETLIR